METLKGQEIEYDLLFEENEEELYEMLVHKKYTYIDTGNMYEGQWFMGFRHGKGIM